MSSGTKMPPLGLSPKHILQYGRVREIAEAMLRYIAVGKTIPIEWYNELEEIIVSHNKSAVE